jgi:DNA (cytosine-5)-methyltransferase 3A
MRWLTSEKGKKSIEKRYCNIDPEKAGCLTVRAEQSWNANYVHRNGLLTRLTTREYERLQTLPDGYTDMISATQAYRAIGNAWTVDVVAHIFQNIC